MEMMESETVVDDHVGFADQSEIYWTSMDTKSECFVREEMKSLSGSDIRR